MWAKPIAVGNFGGMYELQNSPFFARGVSYLDIVMGELRPGDDDTIHYIKTYRPSRHSTYRAIVKDGEYRFDEYWNKLQNYGCTYEYAKWQSGRLYSIDVPPEADIYGVYKILEQAEFAGVWEFEEGHMGQILR